MFDIALKFEMAWVGLNVSLPRSVLNASPNSNATRHLEPESQTGKPHNANSLVLNDASLANDASLTVIYDFPAD